MDITDFREEDITDGDFGNMFMLFDRALVVRSSSSILFFKIDEETNKWKQYYCLPHTRGNIFFIRGNIRIQVVTDEKILFILIDKDTLMPTVENVMYNYMNCSQMMFGKMVRYGITYKTSQMGFTVYTRQSFHNFRVTISTENFEGAVGANLSSIKKYAVGKKLSLCIHDAVTFDLT